MNHIYLTGRGVYESSVFQQQSYLELVLELIRLGMTVLGVACHVPRTSGGVAAAVSQLVKNSNTNPHTQVQCHRVWGFTDQPGSAQTNGFSPVCFLACTCRWHSCADA
jgi:hypothetical protein